MTENKLLRAAIALGAPADVAMIGRLSPKTWLYVRQVEWLRSSASAQDDASADGHMIRRRDFYNFVRDEMKQAAQFLPIPGIAAIYMQHLRAACPTADLDLTLLCVAIAQNWEVLVSAICASAVNVASTSTVEEPAWTDRLSVPLASTEMAPLIRQAAYSMTKKTLPMTLAEGLLGLTVMHKAPGCARCIVASAPFARAISIYALDEALATLTDNIHATSAKISAYSEATQGKAEEAKIPLLNNDGIAMANKLTHFTPGACKDIVAAVVDAQRTADGLVAITQRGDTSAATLQLRTKYGMKTSTTKTK